MIARKRSSREGVQYIQKEDYIEGYKGKGKRRRISTTF